MAKVFNSNVESDLSLKFDCSSIQIGNRSLKTSEKLFFTKNAIRIKFSSMDEPLMIPNIEIVKIELFPKDAKISINTSQKTCEGIQTYLMKCNAFISTCSDMDRIIIYSIHLFNRDIIKVLKNIYLEKIEEIENIPTSKTDTSKTQPLQQQVCNSNNF